MTTPLLKLFSPYFFIVTFFKLLLSVEEAPYPSLGYQKCFRDPKKIIKAYICLAFFFCGKLTKSFCLNVAFSKKKKKRKER